MSSAMTNPMRRLMAATIAAMTAMAVIIIPQSPASAWVTVPGGCKIPSTTIRWSDGTGGGLYGAPANAAIASWDAIAAPITFQLVGNGTHHLTLDQTNFGTDDDFYGIIYTSQASVIPTCSGPGVAWPQKIHAWLNTAWTNPLPAQGKQSIFAHEVGHFLGLGHTGIGPCVSYPLMLSGYATRYGSCNIYAPKADDVNGINALY